MTLLAGVSTVDISPKKPIALFGYPHVERISTGIHDPLFASATYLNNGESAVLMISLEILFLNRSTACDIRSAVSEATSIPQECVLISCTHTHSGPVCAELISWRDDPALSPPDAEYIAFLKQNTIDAACVAVENAKPAELAWATADAATVGGNRLSKDGPTDSEAGVLAIREAGAGSMMAVSIIYGMHPTVMHEDSTLVSADFPFYTRLHLQEHLGKDLPVSYYMAPSGNQSTRYYVEDQTFAEAERLGRKLGRAVAAAIDDLRDADFVAECSLVAAVKEIVPIRRPIASLADAKKLLDEYNEEYSRLQREGAERPKVRTAECAVFGAEGTVSLAKSEKLGDIQKEIDEGRPFQVQVLKIADVCVVGVSGEIFVEYGLEIKSRAKCKTFVITLANGDMLGYIVTPEAAVEGGYEATNAIFASETGKIIVDAAVELIDGPAALSGGY